MPEKSRRHFLRTKDAKTLLQESSRRLNTSLDLLFKGKEAVEVFRSGSSEVFLIDGKPVLVRAGESIYPTLKFDECFALTPKVVVDMGAVRPICKGANIMAPGIRRIEGRFEKNSIVFVVDEKHGKPIAVGEILYGVEEVKNVKQGIVVKNFHYVGDSIWGLLKQLTSAG